MKGEFEKRAKTLIERETKEPQEDGSPDPYYYGHRDGVKALLKVVDDARKEFPILEAGAFSKLSDGTIMDYWAKEVFDWRKKWFGEKNANSA